MEQKSNVWGACMKESIKLATLPFKVTWTIYRLLYWMCQGQLELISCATFKYLELSRFKCQVLSRKNDRRSKTQSYSLKYLMLISGKQRRDQAVIMTRYKCYALKYCKYFLT
jgi:hypothetical protein